MIQKLLEDNYYKSEDYILEEDIYDFDNLTNVQKKYYNKDFDNILQYIIDTEGSNSERHPFLNWVRMVESGGKIDDKTGITEFPYGEHSAEAKTSTASGVYQFIDENVEIAKNRARNYGVSEEFLKTLDNDPTNWDNVQADVMLFASLFPRNLKKGKENTFYGVEGGKGVVNDLMEDILFDYDRKAMEDMYFTFHHSTDLDKYPNTRGIPPYVIERVKNIEVPEYKAGWWGDE